MKHLRLVTLVLILSALACSLPVSTQLPPEETEEAPPSAPTQPEDTTPIPEEVISTPAIPQGVQPASGLDQAWLGGFGCGVTLLDNQGNWFGFREESGALSTDQIYDIALDPSGEAWIANSLDISLTDGQNWRQAATDFYGGGDAITIDASGNVWTVGYDRASFFDGTTWTSYQSNNFGNSEFVNLVKDVAVDAEGRAWVATSSSVAMFDGTMWTAWEEGAGFVERYFLETIAAGPDGRVWVGHSDGVLLYDGQGWTEINLGSMTPQIQDIAVAPDGRVWVATHNDGASVYDGQGWTTYTRDNSGILSDRVRAIAFDGQGRVWLGTTWGLSVFDGTNWTSYTMSTSGLAAPCVETIAVGGNGPTLPPPTEVKLGSVTGLIVLGTQPVANATIVLCSDDPGMLFSGPHPCSEYPFFYEATTDSEGRYTLTDIPIGEYHFTWRIPEGEWMAYLIGGGKIIVREGVMTEVPSINAEEE